jgi:hypothetical protein
LLRVVEWSAAVQGESPSLLLLELRAFVAVHAFVGGEADVFLYDHASPFATICAFEGPILVYALF